MAEIPAENTPPTLDSAPARPPEQAKSIHVLAAEALVFLGKGILL